jgi:hypothetical protein
VNDAAAFPASVGALIAVTEAWPHTVPIAACSFVLVVWGTLAFAAARASRRWRGGRTAGSRGALGSPGLRTLVLASVMDGMTFGTLELVVPAFAQRNGSAGTAGVLLADSNLVMGGLLALVGLSIAPAAAITFVLIGKLVPADAVTESFTWLSTGVITGFALGGAAAGVIVEGASVTAALVAMAGFALGGTCVIFSRRATLRPEAEHRASLADA